MAKEVGIRLKSCRRASLLRLLFVLFVSFAFFFNSVAYGLEVTARAAVVLEGETERILYAKNPDLKLPPASTTKLVTAMVVLDHLNPEDIVRVSKKAARTPSVSPRLLANQKLRVSDLLYLSLMRSINGATVALAETVAGSEWAFVKLMNKKAQDLGAMNTRFINASGLPGKGQYITALDLARIMKASLSYPLLKEIMNTREKVLVTDSRSFVLKNTNRMLWMDDCFIGGKTGFTRAARHCLAFAATKGQSTFVAALLGEGVRDSLWQNASALLSTSVLVASGDASPEIYVNAETPVLLASYDISKSAKKTKHKHSKKKISKKKTAAKTGTIYHKVKKGENLTTIAKKYHLGLQELKDLNGINTKKEARIKAGQRLKVGKKTIRSKKPLQAAGETAKEES